jgi:hypothetical protein
MIRIVVRQLDLSVAIQAQGPVIEQYRTFDVDAPELEKYLLERRPDRPFPRARGLLEHVEAWVIGAEIAVPGSQP